MMKTIVVIGIMITALAVALPAAAQEGTLDLGQSIDEQIAYLEQLANGGMEVHKTVAFLQWLVELYTITGAYNMVEDCYARMLWFYPNDVAIHNAYGKFLMEKRKHYVHADRVLRDAHLWGTAADPHPPALGDTYEIWSQTLYRNGEYDRALGAARLGVDFRGENVSAATLRTMGATLVALERYDEAAETYVGLIAREGGVNHEDINVLQLFIPRTTKYREGSVRDMIAAAVEKGRNERIARIEAEGGRVVSVQAQDDVMLEATLRQSEGGGAVLLVPEPGTIRDLYTPYAQLLFVDDITTLAIDLRGHGGSRSDSLPSPDTISPEGRSVYSVDIAAGINYLHETLGVATDRIAIVAPGTACALVEKAIYATRSAPNVVYLSPSFANDDRDLETAASFHADRPVLLMYSDEDLGAMESTEWFRDIKQREHLAVLRLHAAGRGIDILQRDTKALESFQEWLRRELAQR